jgi:hypothetical protein
MSAWRRQALELLPEHRGIIEAADNPMTLWIELLWPCENAHHNENEDTIRRFYQFAEKCWRSPDADVRTAVACAFYEHLPTKPVMRRGMPRLFSQSAYAELREVFQYHLSPDEAVELEREFLEARQQRSETALRRKPGNEKAGNRRPKVEGRYPPE